MEKKEKFVIKGGNFLKGEVEIEGYKNAAGPCLAAALLAEEECILDNLPLVEDIFSLIELLKTIGVQITWLSDKKIKVKSNNLNLEKINFELIKKTRISLLLYGVFLALFEKFKITHPGGDKLGTRDITTHIDSFRKLNVKTIQKDNFYYFEKGNIKEDKIVLKEFSVTATENLMLFLAKHPKKVVIKNAACEPQVQNLGKMLKKMGVKIKGLGTHTITIEGKKKLKGCYHKIIFDPIVAGTFIIAGSLLSKKLVLKNVEPLYLESFLDKLEEIGVKFKQEKNFIEVFHSQNLKPVKVQALPYPGFPTDLLPFIAVLLTQAKGKSLIHDPLYENRFNYAQELKKMNADIEIIDPHRALIFGKSSLYGRTIESWDIRAGTSLVIAALLAKGKTEIYNIYQIDRGNEKIDEKLQKLGADIKRQSL